MPVGNREYLDEMEKSGEEWSGSGGSGIVGKVLIEFGLHRYVAGHDFWEFWRPIPDPKASKGIASKLSEKLKEAGCADQPTFGVKITVRKDVLSRDDPYKTDLQEFTPKWQADGYDLLVDAIEKGQLFINEEFYGRVQMKANPYSVKQGEAGKTEKDQEGNARYPTIRVPVEKFANEAAAKATVENVVAAPETKWSETAMKEHGSNLEGLEAQATEIYDFLKKAKEGIAWNNDPKNYPLPDDPSEANLKDYIAKIYDIEASDIDLLIPF